MVGVQPGFAFAVAHLLPPIRLHAGAMAVPYERGGGESDAQTPACSSTHSHRRPREYRRAVDRKQRVASKRHVAGMCSACGRRASRGRGLGARHALPPGVVWRHDIPVAGADPSESASAGRCRSASRVHPVSAPVRRSRPLRAPVRRRALLSRRSARRRGRRVPAGDGCRGISRPSLTTMSSGLKIASAASEVRQPSIVPAAS